MAPFTFDIFLFTLDEYSFPQIVDKPWWGLLRRKERSSQ
jgi:hypothetical protein